MRYARYVDRPGERVVGIHVLRFIRALCVASDLW